MSFLEAKPRKIQRCHKWLESLPKVFTKGVSLDLFTTILENVTVKSINKFSKTSKYSRILIADQCSWPWVSIYLLRKKGQNNNFRNGQYEKIFENLELKMLFSCCTLYFLEMYWLIIGPSIVPFESIYFPKHGDLGKASKKNRFFFRKKSLTMGGWGSRVLNFLVVLRVFQ